MLIRNTPELIDNNVIKTYSCGSPPLHDFLEQNGMGSIYRYKQEKNKKTIWVYLLTDELSHLLTVWSDSNPYTNGGE